MGNHPAVKAREKRSSSKQERRMYREILKQRVQHYNIERLLDVSFRGHSIVLNINLTRSKHPALSVLYVIEGGRECSFFENYMYRKKRIAALSVV